MDVKYEEKQRFVKSIIEHLKRSDKKSMDHRTIKQMTFYTLKSIELSSSHDKYRSSVTYYSI